MKYEVKVNVVTPSGWQEQDVMEALMITDLNQDMKKVAVQIGYYGSQAAGANALVARLDAEFTGWKANTKQEVLAADPKLAEWKTKAIVEARPEYQTFSEKISQAKQNAESLWSVYNGFRAKAPVLQSSGAIMREEMGATGLNTKAPVKTKQKV